MFFLDSVLCFLLSIVLLRNQLFFLCISVSRAMCRKELNHNRQTDLIGVRNHIALTVSAHE